MYSGKTNKVLAICKKEIERLSKSTVENIWKIGEYLSIAKEAIILETGDGRAPGFVEWVEKEFGFSQTTAWRMMNAYKHKLEDLEVIWGNEIAGGRIPKLSERSHSFTNGRSQEASSLRRNSIHFLIHVETSNKIVIDVLQGLKNEEYEDTIIHSFETSLGWCKRCGNPLETRGSELCERCQKAEVARRPIARQEART